MASAIRADSCLAQYLAEHPSPDAAGRAAALISAGNRLWYAADLIGASATADDGWNQEALDGAAQRLATRYGAAAAKGSSPRRRERSRLYELRMGTIQP